MIRLKRLIATISKKYGLYHGYPMAFYMIAYMIWFAVIERIPRRYYIQVILKADRFIPLIEVFVIPYMSWFFFVAFGLVAVYYADREAFDKMCTVLMIGMTFFLLVSTFFPNKQPLRLFDLPRKNVFTWMIRKLWTTDTPTNVWPSIHVYNTAAIEIGFLKADSDRMRRRSFRVLTLIWSVLIIASTVFIKQHSLFDVLSALAIIAVAYGYVYMAGHVLRFEKWDKWALAFEKRYAQ